MKVASHGHYSLASLVDHTDGRNTCSILIVFMHMYNVRSSDEFVAIALLSCAYIGKHHINDTRYIKATNEQMQWLLNWPPLGINTPPL